MFRKFAVAGYLMVLFFSLMAVPTFATSDKSSSDQVCNGDPSGKSDSGNGANSGGPYDNTCPQGPSQNGNGNGNATGRPCMGCVGNADDKNPKGQYPNGSDHNHGYECDSNHGIGRGNPAHTTCTPAPPPDCTPSAANNFCGAGTPSPECTPSAANNFCGTGNPPTTVGGTDNSCPSGIMANGTCGSSVLGDSFGSAPATEVLGARFSKPKLTSVLGVQFTRGQALARTGSDAPAELMLAIALIGVGCVLVSRKSLVRLDDLN